MPCLYCRNSLCCGAIPCQCSAERECKSCSVVSASLLCGLCNRPFNRESLPRICESSDQYCSCFISDPDSLSHFESVKPTMNEEIKHNTCKRTNILNKTSGNDKYQQVVFQTNKICNNSKPTLPQALKSSQQMKNHHKSGIFDSKDQVHISKSSDEISNRQTNLNNPLTLNNDRQASLHKSDQTHVTYEQSTPTSTVRYNSNIIANALHTGSISNLQTHLPQTINKQSNEISDVTSDMTVHMETPPASVKSIRGNLQNAKLCKSQEKVPLNSTALENSVTCMLQCDAACNSVQTTQSIPCITNNQENLLKYSAGANNVQTQIHRFEPCTEESQPNINLNSVENEVDIPQPSVKHDKINASRGQAASNQSVASCNNTENHVVRPTNITRSSASSAIQPNLHKYDIFNSKNANSSLTCEDCNENIFLQTNALCTNQQTNYVQNFSNFSNLGNQTCNPQICNDKSSGLHEHADYVPLTILTDDSNMHSRKFLQFIPAQVGRPYIPYTLFGENTFHHASIPAESIQTCKNTEATRQTLLICSRKGQEPTLSHTKAHNVQEASICSQQVQTCGNHHQKSSVSVECNVSKEQIHSNLSAHTHKENMHIHKTPHTIPLQANSREQTKTPDHISIFDHNDPVNNISLNAADHVATHHITSPCGRQHPNNVPLLVPTHVCNHQADEAGKLPEEQKLTQCGSVSQCSSMLHDSNAHLSKESEPKFQPEQSYQTVNTASINYFPWVRRYLVPGPHTQNVSSNLVPFSISCITYYLPQEVQPVPHIPFPEASSMNCHSPVSSPKITTEIETKINNENRVRNIDASEKLNQEDLRTKCTTKAETKTATNTDTFHKQEQDLNSKYEEYINSKSMPTDFTPQTSHIINSSMPYFNEYSSELNKSAVSTLNPSAKPFNNQINSLRTLVETGLSANTSNLTIAEASTDSQQVPLQSSPKLEAKNVETNYGVIRNGSGKPEISDKNTRALQEKEIALDKTGEICYSLIGGKDPVNSKLIENVNGNESNLTLVPPESSENTVPITIENINDILSENMSIQTLHSTKNSVSTAESSNGTISPVSQSSEYSKSSPSSPFLNYQTSANLKDSIGKMSPNSSDSSEPLDFKSLRKNQDGTGTLLCLSTKQLQTKGSSKLSYADVLRRKAKSTIKSINQQCSK